MGYFFSKKRNTPSPKENPMPKTDVFGKKKKLIKKASFFSRCVSLGILKPLSFRKERGFNVLFKPSLPP
jgi:hypothetical protein